MTAYSLRVPRLLLHGRCQFRAPGATNVSISVFNGLREERSAFPPSGQPFRCRKLLCRMEILYGAAQIRSRNLIQREEGKVAESSPACCGDKSGVCDSLHLVANPLRQKDR